MVKVILAASELCFLGRGQNLDMDSSRVPKSAA